MTQLAPAAVAAPSLRRWLASPLPALVVALLALWLALPPVAVRVPVVPLLVGAAAVGLSITAGRLGAGRPAWLVGGMGVLGAVVGAWATGVPEQTLREVISWPGLVVAALLVATPIAFAALGGVISERSGVMNIGLEGMMLSGAFFAVVGSALTGSWAIGVVLGVVAGVVLAALFGLFTVVFGANQVVAGIAVNFLALGVTGYGYAEVFGLGGSPIDLPKVPTVHLPTESLGPWGEAVSNLNLLVWLCLAATVAIHLFLFRSVQGMRLRAIGEKPAAADTAGISVLRTRMVAVAASGALAALGGAYLSIGYVGGFNENMTSGRGYIALAAMIFGGWRPLGALGAALLFGLAQALVLRVPDMSPAVSSLAQALPYALTVIAVIGVIGKAAAPAAIGIPYRRRER